MDVKLVSALIAGAVSLTVLVLSPVVTYFLNRYTERRILKAEMSDLFRHLAANDKVLKTLRNQCKSAAVYHYQMLAVPKTNALLDLKALRSLSSESINVLHGTSLSCRNYNLVVDKVVNDPKYRSQIVIDDLRSRGKRLFEKSFQSYLSLFPHKASHECKKTCSKPNAECCCARSYNERSFALNLDEDIFTVLDQPCPLAQSHWDSGYDKPRKIVPAESEPSRRKNTGGKKP